MPRQPSAPATAASGWRSWVERGRTESSCGFPPQFERDVAAPFVVCSLLLGSWPVKPRWQPDQFDPRHQAGGEWSSHSTTTDLCIFLRCRLQDLLYLFTCPQMNFAFERLSMFPPLCEEWRREGPDFREVIIPAVVATVRVWLVPFGKFFLAWHVVGEPGVFWTTICVSHARTFLCCSGAREACAPSQEGCSGRVNWCVIAHRNISSSQVSTRHVFEDPIPQLVTKSSLRRPTWCLRFCLHRNKELIAHLPSDPGRKAQGGTCHTEKKAWIRERLWQVVPHFLCRGFLLCVQAWGSWGRLLRSKTILPRFSCRFVCNGMGCPGISFEPF